MSVVRRAMQAVAVASALVGVSTGSAWAQASAPAPAPAPAAQPDVDLKLFDKAEVDRSRGCTVALWQANRDPDADRYAYLFIEQLTGANHARQPARIKIGTQVVTLTRVAVGGKTSGYGLSEYQLYRMGENEFVILELKLGPIEGEAVDIEGGAMTVIQRGRQVFRATVKGGAGCMTAPVPAPAPQAVVKPNAPGPAPVVAKPPAGFAPPASFERYVVRPDAARPVMAAAQKRFSCSPDVMRSGITGFQMSEESAIWQIPCDRFAYQASSVFALVYLTSPGDNLTFLSFEAPKGQDRGVEPAVLMDPTWDLRSRTVTGFMKDRGAGDCGTLERYRVGEDGRFVLWEFRRKATCDGVGTRPEDYPLVFRR